jgi:hypothetical protein
MLPWPVGEGNCVSLKSVDADSRLLCRSSKLTDGRNSYAPVDSATSFGPPFRPKENREWLLEDDALNIGTLASGFVVEVVAVEVTFLRALRQSHGQPNAPPQEITVCLESRQGAAGRRWRHTVE